MLLLRREPRNIADLGFVLAKLGETNRFIAAIFVHDILWSTLSSMILNKHQAISRVMRRSSSSWRQQSWRGPSEAEPLDCLNIQAY